MERFFIVSFIGTTGNGAGFNSASLSTQDGHYVNRREFEQFQLSQGYKAVCIISITEVSEADFADYNA